MSRFLVFAKTTPGLERTLRAEITNVLGSQGAFLENGTRIVPEKGVVAVWVSQEGLWQLVHRSRVAERLRIHLHTLQRSRLTYKALGAVVEKSNWRAYFPKTVIPPVRVKLPNGDISEPFSNPNTAALQSRLGKWIFDRLCGAKKVILDPNVEHQWQEVPRYAALSPTEKQNLAKTTFADHSQVYFRLEGTVGTLTLDALSGLGDAQLLDRRGYRQQTTHFALREHLAAACARRAKITPPVTLWDPFCGTGTIPIEHLAMLKDIPSFFGGDSTTFEPESRYAQKLPVPRIVRSQFAFQKWPLFEKEEAKYKELLDGLLNAAKANISRPSILAIGSDVNPKSLEAARFNSERSQLRGFVNWLEGDFEEVYKRYLVRENTYNKGFDPDTMPLGILTNLPYGSPAARREIRELRKASYLERQADRDLSLAIEHPDWREKEEANWRGDDAPTKKATKKEKELQLKEEQEYEQKTLELYQRFGKFLKRHPQISPVFVITGHPRFTETSNLKWMPVMRFLNGGVNVHLFKLVRPKRPLRQAIQQKERKRLPFQVEEVAEEGEGKENPMPFQEEGEEDENEQQDGVSEEETNEVTVVEEQKQKGFLTKKEKEAAKESTKLNFFKAKYEGKLRTPTYGNLDQNNNSSKYYHDNRTYNNYNSNPTNNTNNNNNSDNSEKKKKKQSKTTNPHVLRKNAKKRASYLAKKITSAKKKYVPPEDAKQAKAGDKKKKKKNNKKLRQKKPRTYKKFNKAKK